MFQGLHSAVDNHLNENFLVNRPRPCPHRCRTWTSSWSCILYAPSDMSVGFQLTFVCVLTVYPMPDTFLNHSIPLNLISLRMVSESSLLWSALSCWVASAHSLVPLLCLCPARWSACTPGNSKYSWQITCPSFHNVMHIRRYTGKWPSLLYKKSHGLKLTLTIM
jgi:hypothetical protein